MKKFTYRLLDFLASVKLAVVVLVSVAISCMAGTILESLYDTPTAQYWVYRSGWFKAILVLLAINLFFVMVSRWPWKKHHASFLLAHIGILMMLLGSWLTDQFGIDGNIRITEGQTSNIVELDRPILIVHDGTEFRVFPFTWMPPNATFRPISLKSKSLPYDLKVTKFLSHADGTPEFVPAESGGAGTGSAIKFLLKGGPMKINQEVWLWNGHPNWSVRQMGPALFSFGFELKKEPGKPSLSMVLEKDGSLKYVAYSTIGNKVSGMLSKNDLIGKSFRPGWMGDLTVTVLNVIPKAKLQTNYAPSRLQYGMQAPPSAIEVTAGATGASSFIWLGLGDRTSVTLEGKQLEIGYFLRRVVLPFSVKLDRFNIDRYEGTMDPSAYSSRVSILDGKSAQKTRESLISMNEPLKEAGFTLYQASYEDADPRPITSILSVNQDPGRIWKYIGSIILVLGCILLFHRKLKAKSRA